MSRCEFKLEAEADLAQIGDYIARDSAANAIRLVRRIRERCERLVDSPLIGVARPDLNAGYRSIPVRGTPYIIIYLPIEDGVEILQVRHGHRAIP